jgi:hypothetical protein
VPVGDTPTAEISTEPAPAAAEPFPLWPATEEVHRGRHTEQARIEEWPPPQFKVGRVAGTPPSSKPVGAARSRMRHPRRPAGGLVALLILALLAVFFAWTSAEPLWLAVGRGEAGTATITRCQGQGVLRRCVATFRGEHHTVERVTVLGATAGERAVGVELSARMVGPTGRMAYVGDAEGLHARWSVGLGLLLLCGAAIAWLTGALRLPTRRTRLVAVLLSFALPLTLLMGALAYAYPR